MGVKKGEKNPNYPKNRKSRYYASAYNESLKIKDKFSVPETQELINLMYKSCEAYGKERLQSQRNGYKRVLGNFVLNLDDDFNVSSIDGAFLTDFYANTSGRREYTNPVSKDLIYHFLVLNKKYHWHPELDIVADNTFPFWYDIQNLQYLVIPLLDGSKDPRKCRLLKARTIRRRGNLVLTLLDFDTDNRFIQDLLIEYHHSQHDVIPRVYQVDFISRFAESLNYELPDDIYGFNADTLLRQERFFSAIRREPELECRFFYRFILEKQGSSKTIGIHDGINVGYLMSESFYARFSDGYRYVPINPNEPIPVYDKWAVSPNGLEQRVASDKPENIRYIDFSRISDATIREAAKAWFWNEAKAGFENRQRNALFSGQCTLISSYRQGLEQT